MLPLGELPTDFGRPVLIARCECIRAASAPLFPGILGYRQRLLALFNQIILHISNGEPQAGATPLGCWRCIRTSTLATMTNLRRLKFAKLWYRYETTKLAPNRVRAHIDVICKGCTVSLTLINMLSNTDDYSSTP